MELQHMIFLNWLSYNLMPHHRILILSSCLKLFLDSPTEVNDPKINIPGYNLLRCDHPSNLKRGCVCMFYKEYLPINRRDDLCTLTECIVTEINLGKTSVFFTLSYRSPSQTTDEFEVYSQNLNLILTNVDALSPFCHVLIGERHSYKSW